MKKGQLLLEININMKYCTYVNVWKKNTHMVCVSSPTNPIHRYSTSSWVHTVECLGTADCDKTSMIKCHITAMSL